AATLGLPIATVLIRTLTFTPDDEKAARDDLPNIRADKSALALSRAVQFRTTSHAQRVPSTPEQWHAFHAYLRNSYPRVHRSLQRETVAGQSVLYTWRGSQPTLAPVVLMGHMDVVPVDQKDLGKWKHPPYSGKIADGYVWGRGT